MSKLILIGFLLFLSSCSFYNKQADGNQNTQSLPKVMNSTGFIRTESGYFFPGNDGDNRQPIFLTRSDDGEYRDQSGIIVHDPENCFFDKDRGIYDYIPSGSGFDAGCFDKDKRKSLEGMMYVEDTYGTIYAPNSDQFHSCNQADFTVKNQRMHISHFTGGILDNSHFFDYVYKIGDAFYICGYLLDGTQSDSKFHYIKGGGVNLISDQYSVWLLGKGKFYGADPTQFVGYIQNSGGLYLYYGTKGWYLSELKNTIVLENSLNLSDLKFISPKYLNNASGSLVEAIISDGTHYFTREGKLILQ